MAALPTNGTKRAVVRYQWRSISYDTLFRFDALVTSVEAANAIDAFNTNLAPFMRPNWVVMDAVWYEQGQNFSVPMTLATAGLSGTGQADTTNMPDAFQQQVLGRDNQGRRASWYFQGLAVLLDQDQRLALDGGPAGALINGITTLVGEGLVTISGAAPAIKPYVNLVVNDHLTARSRGA